MGTRDVQTIVKKRRVKYTSVTKASIESPTPPPILPVWKVCVSQGWLDSFVVVGGAYENRQTKGSRNFSNNSRLG